MPVCTWCGIESKNELVCDWCKRPLALRAQRKNDGRTAVDLLRDGDEEGPNLPKVLFIVGAVVACLALLLVWVLSSRPANNAPTAANTEYTVQRDPAFPTNQSDVRTPVAQPVFLPQPQAPAPVQAPARTYTIDPTQGGSREGTAPKIRVIINDPDSERGASAPAVRLSSGAIRWLGGKRGMAVGRVSIVNSTESHVVDLRLEAEINGHTYTLRPFEGNLDKPRTLASLDILPGERITLPVIVNGYSSGRKPAVLPARIRLESFLDSGKPYAQDEIMTP